MSSHPHLRPSADRSPTASDRQSRARLGQAFGASTEPVGARGEAGSESRLVVVVEPDEHVPLLAELTLGEIAEVVGCKTSEEALATMRARWRRRADLCGHASCGLGVEPGACP